MSEARPWCIRMETKSKKMDYDASELLVWWAEKEQLAITENCVGLTRTTATSSIINEFNTSLQEPQSTSKGIFGCGIITVEFFINTSANSIGELLYFFPRETTISVCLQLFELRQRQSNVRFMYVTLDVCDV